MLTATPTNEPTVTPKPPSTSTITPKKTSTVTPRPFLISYTFYSDGGDDLWRCLYGYGEPAFILYTDGLLVFLRDSQYWQSFLSQDDITALLDNLSNTGLFLHAEAEYNDGNSELLVDGKRYYAPWNLSDSDPLAQAIDVIIEFQPKDMVQYIPESLLLEIYQVSDWKTIGRYLPQPTPIVQEWVNDPLSEYGEVWETISGKDVPVVMAQFGGFPDVQLLKDGEIYYIAAICADFPRP